MPRKTKFPPRDDVTNRTIDSFGDLSPRSDNEDDDDDTNAAQATGHPQSHHPGYSSVRFSSRGHDSDDENASQGVPSRSSAASTADNVSTKESGGYFCGSGSAIAHGYHAIGSGLYFVADKLVIAPTRYMFGWQTVSDETGHGNENDPINFDRHNRPAIADKNEEDGYGSNVAEASDHDRSAPVSEGERHANAVGASRSPGEKRKKCTFDLRPADEREADVATSAAVSRIASAIAAKANTKSPPPPPPSQPPAEPAKIEPDDKVENVPESQHGTTQSIALTIDDLFSDEPLVVAPTKPQKSNGPPKPRAPQPKPAHTPSTNATTLASSTTKPGHAASTSQTTFNRNITTLRELKSILAAMGPFLPVTVLIDTQIGTMLNKGGNQRGKGLHGQSKESVEHLDEQSTTDDTVVDIHICVQGPVRFQSPPSSATGSNPSSQVPSNYGLPFAPTLSKAEDLIVEDFLLGHPNRRITSITVSDIDFTATLTTNSPGRFANSSLSADPQDELSSADHQHIQKKVLHFINAIMMGGGGNGGEQQEKVESAASQSLPPCSEVTFQRCLFSPLQLQDAFEIPKDGSLQSLSFINCPLADPHISTLVRLSRRFENLFVNLRILRIARGNLSANVLQALLRFFDEEIENPRLCELEVPSGLVPVVMRNPLTQRLPRLLVNGKTAPK